MILSKCINICGAAMLSRSVPVETSFKLFSDFKRIVLSGSISDFNVLADGIKPQKFVEMMNFADEVGDTFLHMTCKLNRPEMFELLLLYGAKYRMNKAGEYPIIEAIRSRSTKCIEKIIKLKFHIKASSGYDYTALFDAVHFGHIMNLRMLVKGGLKLDSIAPQGDNVIHFAVKSAKIAMLKEVLALFEGPNLELRKRLIDAVNYNNETPLHLACYRGLDYLKVLLDHGADPIKGEISIAHLAAVYSDFSIFEYCFSHFKPMMSKIDDSGCTPLMKVVLSLDEKFLRRAVELHKAAKEPLNLDLEILNLRLKDIHTNGSDETKDKVEAVAAIVKEAQKKTKTRDIEFTKVRVIASPPTAVTVEEVAPPVEVGTAMRLMLEGGKAGEIIRPKSLSIEAAGKSDKDTSPYAGGAAAGGGGRRESEYWAMKRSILARSLCVVSPVDATPTAAVNVFDESKPRALRLLDTPKEKSVDIIP